MINWVSASGGLNVLKHSFIFSLKHSTFCNLVIFVGRQFLNKTYKREGRLKFSIILRTKGCQARGVQLRAGQVDNAHTPVRNLW